MIKKRLGFSLTVILFLGLGRAWAQPAASCTLTSASLSWAADDAGEIFINGNQADVCPNGCYVGVNGISIPTSWLNPAGDNVIAAYDYSVDTVYSGATWLLTLNYSNCSPTYVEPGSCVVDQYLFDPNSSSGLPSAGSFPANWTLPSPSFDDSSWSAPGTMGPTLPPVAFANELIPNPPGGTVFWVWGVPDWLTVAVGDAWMFREHFQLGASSCASPTPTVTPTPSPTATPTPKPGCGPCGLVSASLSWAADDGGEIFVNGSALPPCQNGCWLGFNSIAISPSLINTTGDNVVASYVYAADVTVSANTWLLTLNYSNCSPTYVMPNSSVLEQSLTDINGGSAMLPPASAFPTNWTQPSPTFNDSTWSAPGVIFPMPSIYSDETIPNPLGGGVSWIWGDTNWLNPALSLGYMFREHFQVGLSSCPTPTPSPGSGANPPTQGTCYIYPSPARGGQASLAYYMAQPGGMDLKIWNEKAELAAHVTDQKPSGVQATPFSISGFASGVYFYRVTLQYASGQGETLKPGKFVVTR